MGDGFGGEVGGEAGVVLRVWCWWKGLGLVERRWGPVSGRLAPGGRDG